MKRFLQIERQMIDKDKENLQLKQENTFLQHKLRTCEAALQRYTITTSIAATVRANTSAML